MLWFERWLEEAGGLPSVLGLLSQFGMAEGPGPRVFFREGYGTWCPCAL